MLTSPKFSVIIPTYNYGHYLAEAIRSVLDQTFLDFEVIVVDDGSADNTSQVVADYGDAVQYIYQENRGYAAARNLAIRHSSGELIAFLDADDAWLPQKLELQAAYLDRHPEVGVVSANCYYMDAQGNITGVMPGKPQATGWIFERILLTGNFIAMPTVGIRRQCFETSGLFDESLRTTVDWDLWLRLSRKFPFGYINQYLAKYRLHPANMHKQAHIKARDTLAIFDKLYSEPNLPSSILSKRGRAYCGAHLNIAWRYLSSGQPGLARKHLGQAIKHYPACMLKPFFLRLALGSYAGHRLYAKARSWRDAARRHDVPRP